MTIKEQLGPSAYEDLLAASLSNLGETNKMQCILEKFKCYNTLRLVTLGGSITEGTSSHHEIFPSYGQLIQDFLSHSLYGERQVDFLNLGISCSFTMLGILLAESHITDFAPDLIIVEFSVNESPDKGGIARFESLIRRLISLPNHPVVLILTLADENGYTCSAYMSHIGKHYQLPVINIENALKPYFESQALCWADYSHDNIHPHGLGHQLIADCCTHYLRHISLLKQKSSTKELLPSCCFLAPYEHLHFLSAKTLYEMSDTNFTLTQIPGFLFPELLYNNPLLSQDAQHLIFSLNCKTLIFLFIQNNDVNFATATLCIDYVLTHYLQSYCQFVSQYPRTECVLEDALTQMHHIALSLNDLDASKDFYLIGALWC